jgi:uncharacterized Rmd1/YagE family protein
MVETLMNTLPGQITRGSLDKSNITRRLNQLYDVKKANLTILDLPDYFWVRPGLIQVDVELFAFVMVMQSRSLWDFSS